MPKSEPNRNLDPIAAKLIRREVWSTVIPTGITLSIVAFLLGFFVNEVARSKAYTDAMDKFIGHMQTTATSAGDAKARAETAATQAETLTKQIESLQKKAANLEDQGIELAKRTNAAQLELEATRTGFALQSERMEQRASEFRQLAQEQSTSAKASIESFESMKRELSEIMRGLRNDGVVPEKKDGYQRRDRPRLGTDNTDK